MKTRIYPREELDVRHYATHLGNSKLVFSPQMLALYVLLTYSLIFFPKTAQRDYIFTGDTLSEFAEYSYQYSGLARGEYPLWNPLVRSGHPEELIQVLYTAHPISNIVAAISVLLKVKDVVLSYLILIYLLILLYALGSYLLISLWTGNRYAGVFALILSLGTSSVFYARYHHSFVLILHAVPWVLYAATKYFREFKFRYLLLLALACTSLLYSYEVVMAASYLIMLSIAAMIFYHKQLSDNLCRLFKIPFWHIFTFGSILLIIVLPALLVFFRLNEDLLPISRVADVKVIYKQAAEPGKSPIPGSSDVKTTDRYAVKYRYVVQTSSNMYPGSASVRFWSWITLFTGIFRSGFEELRQYVGPLAFLLIPAALFSRKRYKDSVTRIIFNKRSWCIALSVVLTFMLVYDIFPVSFLYKLPGFSLIRNRHFLRQFHLFAMVVIASFGLDNLLKGSSKKIFNITSIMLVCFSLAALLSCRMPALVPPTMHNVAVLWISIFTAAGLFLIVNYFPARFIAGSSLVLSAITVLSSSVLFNLLPMSGWRGYNPIISSLHHRTDHSLHFRYERPSDIEKIEQTDPNVKFGMDEFSSYVTLKDNSYKTLGADLTLSSFPLLKGYYLFSSLPGHEQVMKNKFFFFRKCYTSSKPADMRFFMRDPRLFEAMLARGIGIADLPGPAGFSIGPFEPGSVRNFPVEAKEKAFDVNVMDYKANSILMTVSVSQQGLFTYTDLWDDGWKVKVDGREVPLLKVFHAFKGVELSPGVHEIKFYYMSKVLISILAMNIVFIVCALGLILSGHQTQYDGE